MNVLGIHIGHDSSAALVIDGKIVADAAEERFTRIKHYCGLPINAIAFCLDAGNLNLGDVDFVAVPTKSSNPALNFLLDLNGKRAEKRSQVGKMLKLLQKIMKLGIEKPPLYIRNFPIRDSTEIVHVEHHLAHAASAYYTSGINDRTLIVTCDGLGDGISTGVWLGESCKIKPLLKIRRVGSLGWFYGNVTESLGWWHGDGEGKTMGLAPYGNNCELHCELDSFCPQYKSGKLVKSHDFGRAHFWNNNGAIHWHFDEVYRLRKLVEKHGRENIAAEAQRILEEQVENISFPWLEREKAESLCCSGGIFLNVKLNQRIWNSGRIKNHFVFPNAGDGGLAVGAALYVYYEFSGHKKIQRIDDVYWGPEYTNEEIEKIIKNRNLNYEYCEDIATKCARLLSRGKIIGWFQSRMESGPRALGNRSILMSAAKPENKDIINARVKFREAFRPFCPSITEEARNEYLMGSRSEPFMITSFDVNKTKRNEIPAVVHVDGTARPQTVERNANHQYYDLIKKFGDITGVPVIMNTSFNIRGEPIINNPRDAIKCFYDTGLDYLAIGDFLLSKET